MTNQSQNTQNPKSKKSLMDKIFNLTNLKYLLAGTVGSVIGIGLTLGVTYGAVSSINHRYKEQSVAQGKVVDTSWDKDANLYQIQPFVPADLNEKDYRSWLGNIFPQIKYNNDKQLSYWIDYLKSINTEKQKDGGYKYDKLIKQLEDAQKTLNDTTDKYIKSVQDGTYKKDINQYGSYQPLGKLQEQFLEAVAPLQSIREDMYYNWAVNHLPQQLVEKFEKLYKEQRINSIQIGQYAFAYYYSQVVPSDLPPKPMILDMQFWKKSYLYTKGTVPYYINNFYHKIDPNYVSDNTLKKN